MARVSIEDCLNHIENRFALVAVASHRTRQLMSGKTPLVKTKNKEGVTALREIAEGLITTDRTLHKREAAAALQLSESKAAADAAKLANSPRSSVGTSASFDTSDDSDDDSE